MLFIPSDILHPVRCNPANWQAVPATYALESDCHVPILILFQPTEGTGIVKVPFMVLAELAGADNYYFVDYNSVPVPAPLCADPNAACPSSALVWNVIWNLKILCAAHTTTRHRRRSNPWAKH